MTKPPRRIPIWPGAAPQVRRHVPQQLRRGGDCAIAAAATVTGVSYDEAASAAFTLREAGLGGLRPDSMTKLLERLSGVPWRRRPPGSWWSWRTRRLGGMTFPEGLVVAFIADPWRLSRAHAIVASGQIVYDGALPEPVAPREHPNRRWWVTWIFETVF